MNQSKTSILIRGSLGIMTGLINEPTEGQTGGQTIERARHAGPDLRIMDGKIAAMGRLQALPGERVIDAQDCVIYPAWVNTHHHLFQSLLKAVPGGMNASLTPWLAEVPYQFRSRFDEHIFRIAARIGLVELMLSGCGTVADHNYLYHPGQSYDPSEILFDEASRLGLRFVLCRGGATLSRDYEEGMPAALKPEKFEDYMQDMQRLTKRYHQPQADAMQKIVLAPTTPNYSMTPEQMREAAQLARSLGIGLHSHLSETVAYQDNIWAKHKMKPIEFVASLGWLGPDVWFAHLVKLDPEEIALLGKTNTGIAHCPQSNARLGSGIAPVMALAQAGAGISIAVDGAASNEGADMINETHATWQIQRVAQGLNARAERDGGLGEPGKSLLEAERVLSWGTQGGAKILGLSAVGSLNLGQAADLAIYDLSKSPRYFGHHDPMLAPITAGGQAHLRALIVAGREVVSDGCITGMDLAQLYRQANDCLSMLRH